jgi:hypothetical protein
LRLARTSSTISATSTAQPIVYREEVLTVIGVLGDIRQELVAIRQLLEEDGEAEDDT